MSLTLKSFRKIDTMKYFVLLLLLVLLGGCLQEGEKPNDTNNDIDSKLLGEWHSTSYRYEITFHEDQTYESDFLGSGSWHLNNSELILGENTYDYEFVGGRLHLMPMYLFFEKD